MTEHQCRVVHEMIALHTNPKNILSTLPSTELSLVSQGAGVDVAGFFAEELHKDTITNIVQHHPRLHFKNNVCKFLNGQCQRKPNSHIALHCKMGFCNLVQHMGPFEE